MVNGVAPAKKAIPFTDDNVDPELVHQVFRPYLVTLTLAAEDRLKLTDTGNLTGASLQLLCNETGINKRSLEASRPNEMNTQNFSNIHHTLRSAKHLRQYRKNLKATPRGRALLKDWPMNEDGILPGFSTRDVVMRAGALVAEILASESEDSYADYLMALALSCCSRAKKALQ
ncbi:hypothetical protein J2S70_001203 [Trueperella bonasi]|uniref:Uncharacterized protein n=1 Tax=Trueperella bonasi TaxID=312286 RepID=A0ABT9NGU6_9ACTO|nr:hypothetical protein [Trueperella bonasi]MDP9806621.1 hypothetical protein [Trueperella bonasi]